VKTILLLKLSIFISEWMWKHSAWHVYIDSAPYT
jgi:hypothetical protein